jgi:hypothetical protein
LRALLCLSLDGAPAAEVIQVTALSWCIALAHARSWTEHDDRPRVHAAFAALLAECRRWPSPRQLLDHMPPAIKPRSVLRLSGGDEEARKARIEKIIAGLRESLFEEGEPK